LEEIGVSERKGKKKKKKMAREERKGVGE